MSQSPERIRNVVVVGGGTAGWMSATYLAKFLAGRDCSVTLVQPVANRPIGVGEASIPSIVRFLRNMSFDELEFMRYCHATYKLGIEFEGWGTEETSFWHPFGNSGPTVNHLDFFHAWFRSQQVLSEFNSPFADFSLHKHLAWNGLAPRGFRESSRLVDEGSYAYHLDANAFVDYLQVKSVELGIITINETVAQVQAEGGLIQSLVTESGHCIDGDLFIDCTGFEARLIGGELGSEFVSFSDRLLCDRAIVCQTDNMASIASSTNSLAMAAGWRWTIPLANRCGVGYVYSSKYSSSDDARDELTVSLGRDVEARAMQEIELHIGRRAEPWVGNCIAVGLAAGFVEPLESTGIHMIQTAIELLMDYFPDVHCVEPLQKKYNQLIKDQFEEVVDFIQLHYLLSVGHGTEFWEAAKQTPLSEGLRSKLDVYDECGLIDGLSTSAFTQSSYYYILSGNGRLPKRSCLAIEMVDSSDLKKITTNLSKEVVEAIEKYPQHDIFLQFMRDI